MFWNIFKSVKLAVFLLITLAIVAIVGTLIPQGEESIGFVMRLRPETFRIFSVLGLFDVYHTLWFRAILGLLALNLVVCSIDRLPKAWKRMKARPPVDMKRPFEDLNEDNVLVLKGKMELISKRVKGFLQKIAKDIRSKSTDTGCFFYFEEGRYSHLGVYIVHLSIIIILLGGIIGSIWGFEGYMNILEGEKRDVVRLIRRVKPLRLGFYVRCDRFLVDYYKNGMPKEYMSELTFITGQKEVKRQVRVNHPVKFRGITFYQASYGVSIGDSSCIKIINRLSGKSFKVDLKLGQSYQIPDTGTVIKLVDIRKDFARAGPAIFLLVRLKQGKEMKLILFKDMGLAKKRLPAPMLNAAMFNPSLIEPYTFIVKDIPTRYYTGLQVSKDPGVPIVWTGFLMLIIGLMVTFFTSHKRIWVRIIKKGQNKVEVAVSGMSNRDPVSLAKKISSILNGIKKEVSPNANV